MGEAADYFAIFFSEKNKVFFVLKIPLARGYAGKGFLLGRTGIGAFGLMECAAKRKRWKCAGHRLAGNLREECGID